MDENKGAAADQSSDQASTVEVPASAIGGAKVGDTVQFRVISVDAQSGVANLSPVTPSAPSNGSGTDEMAEEFEPEQTAPKGS